MLEQPLKHVVEAALLAAGRPLPIKELLEVFPDELFVSEEDRPKKEDILRVIEELNQDYLERSFQIIEVASGFRIQVRQAFSKWLNSLWDEKPVRYSRALLETLAIIAYRQPVTRGEIEEIRGVAVSTNIIKTLDERGWIRVIGHRDVPGRPAMYGTTKEFLDYFQLKSLDELPSLSEIRDLESFNQKLDLAEFGEEGIPVPRASLELTADDLLDDEQPPEDLDKVDGEAPDGAERLSDADVSVQAVEDVDQALSAPDGSISDEDAGEADHEAEAVCDEAFANADTDKASAL